MSISFSTTVFHDLRERYPTWEQLQEYLESEEGGLFRVADHTDNLFLIRYEKGVSNMDLPHSKWFRSVVWDRTTHSPVSVAPPKTSTLDFPCHTRQDAVAAGIICQEQLDGFMINCFKRAGDDTLYITSRSRLNASGYFYSPKTFRHLFVESYTGWITQSNDPIEPLIQGEAKNFPSPSGDEVAIGFSFLVQHTEHRNVTNHKENSVTLIHQSTTHADGTISFQDTPTPLPFSRCIPLSSIPLTEGAEEMPAWIHEQLRSQPWEVQGIVFKDAFGNRWRFRSESFVAVQSLRGNTSSTLERFIQLYLQNLTHIYIQYYPEDAIAFSFHQESMNYVIRSMYEEYLRLHVRKVAPIGEINKMYHPHLYALHGHYLSHLRPANKKLALNDVYDYLRKQPWQRVVFLFRGVQDLYYEMIRTSHVSV